MPYSSLEVKDGIRFNVAFSSSLNQDIASTGNISNKRPNTLERLGTKFRRVGDTVESARVAANEQNVLLDLLGDARKVVELIGSLGLAAGEVRASLIMYLLC